MFANMIQASTPGRLGRGGGALLLPAAAAPATHVSAVGVPHIPPGGGLRGGGGLPGRTGGRWREGVGRRQLCPHVCRHEDFYVCERTPWCRTFMFGDENFHVRGVTSITFGDTNGHFMFANMATLVGVEPSLLGSLWKTEHVACRAMRCQQRRPSGAAGI